MRPPGTLLAVHVLLLAASVKCFGQDSASCASLYGEGITAQGGIGYCAVRDDHMSTERYAGASSSAAFQWSRVHDTYAFRLGMQYQNAPAIKNHNVSAEVTSGDVFFSDIYPLSPWSVFGTEVNIGLGPSADMFAYYRRQHIALNPGTTPDVYESGAYLFSLGVRLEASVPLGDLFRAGAALQTGLLSLGGGSGSTPNNASGVELLTPFAGLHAASEIVISYTPFTLFSLAAGYRFEIVRVDSWNYLVAAGDNAFLSLTCHL